MDSRVNEMTKAYDLFLAAVAEFMETKQLAGGRHTAATRTALQKLMRRRELFVHACDQAQEAVEHAKQSLCLENLVDVGTSSASAKPPGDLAVNELERITAVGMESTSNEAQLLEQQQPPSSSQLIGRINIAETCEDVAAAFADGTQQLEDEFDFDVDLSAFEGPEMECLGEFDPAIVFGDLQNLVDQGRVSRMPEYLMVKDQGEINVGDHIDVGAGKALMIKQGESDAGIILCEVETSKAQVFKEGESAGEDIDSTGKTDRATSKQGENCTNYERVLLPGSSEKLVIDTRKRKAITEAEHAGDDEMAPGDDQVSYGIYAQVSKGGNIAGDGRVVSGYDHGNDTGNMPEDLKGGNAINGGKVSGYDRVDSKEAELISKRGNVGKIRRATGGDVVSRKIEVSRSGGNFPADERVSGDVIDKVMTEVLKKENAGDDEKDSGDDGADTVMSEVSQGENAADQGRLVPKDVVVDTVMSDVSTEENAGAEIVSREDDQVDTGKAKISREGNSGDVKVFGEEIFTGTPQGLKGENAEVDDTVSGNAEDSGKVHVCEGGNYAAVYKKESGDEIANTTAEALMFKEGKIAGDEVGTDKAKLVKGGGNAGSERVSADGVDTRMSEFLIGENAGDERVTGDGVPTGMIIDVFPGADYPTDEKNSGDEIASTVKAKEFIEGKSGSDEGDSTDKAEVFKEGKNVFRGGDYPPDEKISGYETGSTVKAKEFIEGKNAGNEVDSTTDKVEVFCAGNKGTAPGTTVFDTGKTETALKRGKNGGEELVEDAVNPVTVEDSKEEVVYAGEDEKITGEDEKITGEDEKITGEDEKITGEDEKITGDKIVVNADYGVDAAKQG